MPRTRRFAGFCAAGALVLVLSLVWSPTAGAHAILLSTDPAAGEVLPDAPDRVELGFNEVVTLPADSMVVLDPSGAELDLGAPEVRGTSVVASLPELSVDGSYTVGYRVISDDGHPVRGAFLFHLRERTLTEPLDVGEGAGGWTDLLRSLGTSLALGGLVVAALGPIRRGLREGRPERASVWSWNAVAVGTLLVVAGAVLSVGSDLSDSLSVVWGTASGKVALLAWVLALLGVVASAARAPDRAMLAMVGLSTAAIGLGGHAVSLDPVARSAVLTVAHVVAAVVWSIGLLWLRSTERPTRSARSLTPVALGSVVVLGATGAVLVVDRVPFDELTTSTYGQLSLLKLTLLAVAVAVAAVNRFVLARNAEGDRRLRVGVSVEVVAVAAALVAGTVLAQVPPPGTALPGGPFADRLPFGSGQVELTVEPGARGTNEIHVIAFDDDGRLMALESLEVQLSLPERDLGPLEPELIEITAGHVTSYAQFPLAGTWTVDVVGVVSRFERIDASFEVDIGS